MVSCDLLLKGGSVILPGGTSRADIGVSAGKIVALTSGEAAPSALEVVDISNFTVLPGGIDTHTHLRDPGFTHKEDITTGTTAAAAGGYTMCVGMPNVQPPTTTVELYRQALAIYEKKSLVDFNHNPSPVDLTQIQGLAQAGALGFKLFMVTDTGTDYPHMPGLGVHDHGKVLEIAEEVGKSGLPLMVHAQDQAIVELLDQRSWDQDKYDWRSFARIFSQYDGIGWDAAVSFLIRLQEVVPFHLHVLHIRTRRAVELIRAAKLSGQHLTAETNPHAVMLTNDWAAIEQLGPYALSHWNGPDTTDILWEAMADGTIDVLGTDHAPHTRAEKEVGWTNMWKAANGVPKIQESLPLFLTEVNAGRLSLERFVELFATGPAKVFGLYPRKGVIAVGSDADFAVVDMSAQTVIRDEDMLSKCGWTSYPGRAVQGLPIHTIVRGQFVMRDRSIVGSPGYGVHVAPVPAGFAMISDE